MSAPTLMAAHVTAGKSGQPAITLEFDHNNQTVHSTWVASVALGALGELMRTDQKVMSDEFGSASVDGPNTTGDNVTTGLGVGAVSLGQRFNSPDDEALIKHVEDVAGRFGLTLTMVQVTHPLESALEARFEVPSGATTKWTVDELRTALIGASPSVEAAYIELDSSAGKKLLVAATDYRTGQGTLWYSPGQDARFGAVHGSFFGDSE